MVSGAVRVAEQANGELLVGTQTGELVLVSTFGDQRPLTRLDGAPLELVTDPLGAWHARLADGDVVAGGIWAKPIRVASGARLLLRDCEDARWYQEDSLEFSREVSALGLSTCDHVITGTTAGLVEGQPVSDAAIRRVQSVGEGVLWVDDAGRAGCLRCSSPVPAEGVIDAVALHVAPFLLGEFAWIDAGGTIWIDGD